MMEMDEDEEEVLLVDIGGNIFIVQRSWLDRAPDSLLAHLHESDSTYEQDTGEFLWQEPMPMRKSHIFQLGASSRPSRLSRFS